MWERVGGYAVEVAREDFSPRIAHVALYTVQSYFNPRGGSPVREVWEEMGPFTQRSHSRRANLREWLCGEVRIWGRATREGEQHVASKRAVASGSWATFQTSPEGVDRNDNFSHGCWPHLVDIRPWEMP
jgi:hypothetical protein